MNESIYKKADNDPNYLLVHKRSLIAMSHCMGLAIKSYSICTGIKLDDVAHQLGQLANIHARGLSEGQLNYVIEQLLTYQKETGVIEVKEFPPDEVN